jgi:hypothetical protein
LPVRPDDLTDSPKLSNRCRLRQNGNALGVEITAPSVVPLERLNRVLADLGETPLNEHDYLPVRAA